MWASLLAHAQIEVRQSALAAEDAGMVLSADLELRLNPVLEEVVQRGVPLYFVAEFELTRPRWYWFDESLARSILTYRLSYHALTRQYRLSTGPLHQSFATLEEAVSVMSRIRGWLVADKGIVEAGETYHAAFRMRLDLSQLPKPLQVTAIGSKDWNLGSQWSRWAFLAGGGAVR